MTTDTDGNRLAELEATVAYARAELTKLEARRQRVAEQLSGGSVRDRGYDGGKRAGLQQELGDIDVELSVLDNQRQVAEAEVVQLRHRLQLEASRVAQARRTLAEASERFGGALTWDPAHWPNDPFMSWHRELIRAAATLRAAGEPAPAELTLTLSLRPLDQPALPLVTSPAPAPEAEAEAEVAEEAAAFV